ncbi:6-hydroxymethylpterin diphosphokinase MptE-like protein [Bacillus sp. Cr_A10]|uniref:motility associated factor glycosyltransferase family protein n=1 Tax=Bacillus sp. Cr_A10 TaxID=3033993 RepID=UPI0023D9B3F4|nr:6-hydroxymethylpterin diphosphokinase MptE-like protein [Bacillus sp. Cr_A10]MDF2065822.1 DUF115 domain-containing protein [Bacillus sp. Cr_A10]
MNKDFKIERILTKSGIMTVKVNGFFLHSKYDPLKEAEQFIEKKYKPNNLHILFGYGLGHFANKLKEKFNEQDELLIIDPLAKMFSDNPEIEIISEIYDEKFIMLLESKINKFNRRIQIISSPNYDKLMEEQYRDLLKMTKDRINLNRVSENTVRSFAEIWQRNYIYNLYNTTRDKSLLTLKDKYNLPVIIASGGPSLTKQLPLLKEISNYAIIIAAGSTINTLLKNNIQPDFVVSVDGSENNYYHFKDLNLNDTKYIYSFYSHYSIRESFVCDAYIFDTTGSSIVKKHLTHLTDMEYPSLLGGGSVANYAFTIANYISNGPIALIGQDLAYTDNKTHAEYNKNFFEIDEDFKKKRGIFSTEGYYGEEVLTDYVFFSMKNSFEKLRSLAEKDRKIFNCTEGGILLKGFSQISFRDFCDEYINTNSKKDKILEDVNPVQTHLNKQLHLIEKMEIEVSKYKSIQQILMDSLKVLSLNKSATNFSTKVLKRLNNNDEKLKKLCEEVSFVSIFEPLTLNIQNNYLPLPNETSEEKYNRVFSQNKELYTGLIEAVDLTNEYTNQLILKITKDIKDENYG